MAGIKAAAAVALVATVVMALAACSAAASDLFIHFKDNEKVLVFSQTPRVKLPTGTVFGDGQVFDNAVTTSAGSDGKVVARAQGIFYRSSQGGGSESFDVDKEEFVILFIKSDGQYAGTSFSFGGAFLDVPVQDFSITGATGALAGLKGIVTLTAFAGGSAYKIDINEFPAPNFKSFLAHSV